LRARGVTIAMDDFGTGYSSMARLAGLPIDVLKVDRAFVQQLGSTPQPLIGWMLDLARRTGLRSVVEGVETDEQAVAVRALGADAGQGWLFGRAQPAEQFLRTVRSWSAADAAVG
jgi:sensor c-di-GMP phosphodiesterase-like protein